MNRSITSKDTRVGEVFEQVGMLNVWHVHLFRAFAFGERCDHVSQRNRAVRLVLAE